MKQIFRIISLITITNMAIAQGIHFSQFFNAPMLLNPANTAMLAEDDYRAGVHYRNQYQNISVPYNTVSAFTDFGIGRNNNETNWWGVGGAFWHDQAGAGKLSLTKAQINAAYHVVAGERNMFSFGVSAGYVNRKIDLSNFSFDSQWDEFSFNNDLPSNEKVTSGVTNYFDLQPGVNFSHFDNERLYYKIGASVLHINQPKETFLGGTNRLGLRPVLDFELSYKTNKNFIMSPSVYYTMQKNASELVVGFMTNANLIGNGNYFRNDRNELLTGIYMRVGDALILMSGYRYKNTTFTVSYDHTISGLSKANNGVGAIEFSIIYNNKYGQNSGERRILGCPRF
jgi:type IX secretion system PorP/SprF family membrane protein